MSARDLKSHILPGLLAGSRTGLALERANVATSLQALSLTGQALRFDRPAMPASFQVEEAIADTRAIVPEAMRRSLIRFLRSKRSGPAGYRFEIRIAAKLAARSLRLHPFDIPVLDAFIIKHSENLGAEAMAWAQRQAPAEEKQSYFASDAIDDTNWSQATPVQAGLFIDARRRQDPHGGRTLIEAALPAMRSQHRQYMVAALRIGLNADDRPLLELLAKDRALGVRTTAQTLLTRLATREGATPAAAERIKKGQTGLLKKRATFTLELPADIRTGNEKYWIGEQFAEVPMSAWVAVLGLPEAEMIAAAEKDDNLLLGFAISAIMDRRFDLLDLITRQYLPDAWEPALTSGFVFVDDADFEPFASAGIKPAVWMQEIPVRALDTLTLLPRYLPDSVMKDAMVSKAWLGLLKDSEKIPPDLIDIMANLCPPSQRPALRTQLAPLDPPRTADALNFLDIMDALEATNV